MARTNPTTVATPFHSHSTVLMIQSLTQSSTQSDGPCFPLFPKFPEDIRCLIWRCYLDTPRIIGITNAYYRTLTLAGERSPARNPSSSMRHLRPMAFGQFRSSLRQVNQEARREENRIMQMFNPQTLPFHANLERDVFWFYWWFHVGLGDYSLLGETAAPMPRGLDGRVLRVSRVALDWEWWFEYAKDDKMVAKAMGDLTRAGITQVFLVVHKSVISRNREILFYEPGGPLSEWYGEDDILSLLRSRATTWKELEEDIRQKAKDLQKAQAEKKAKLQHTAVDSGALDETEPEDSNHRKAFLDASWWEIPVFRFVQAVQISAEDAEKVLSGNHGNGWKPHYGERVSV